MTKGRWFVAPAVLLVALVLFQGTLEAQNYQVIVNTSNPTSSLTKQQAANYFLRRLANGRTGPRSRL